ncbi:MAG: hypothetical protein QW735_02795 [archaeon]
MLFTIVIYNADFAKNLANLLVENVANAQVRVKKASDLFDCLALLKQSISSDYLILIGEIEKKYEGAFYTGLAVLQADTGKSIIKKIFSEDEQPPSLEEILEDILNKIR